VPNSQLRSDGRLGKGVGEEWGEHAPLLRTRDRISPDLGEGSLVDRSTGIWSSRCACDSSKQGNDREKGVPHSIQRSGGAGAEKAIWLTEMDAFIMKWRLVEAVGMRHVAWLRSGVRLGLPRKSHGGIPGSR